MTNNVPYLPAAWPAAKNIIAYCSYRYHPLSLATDKNFNLATHIAHDANSTAHNRRLLEQDLNISSPYWLEQTHSSRATRIQSATPVDVRADAAITSESNLCCAVLTADCLPILVCNQQGTEIAAIHGGWRGLANGIIENTIAAMHSQPKDLLLWLGPAIGPNAFSVKKDVFDYFTHKNKAFSPAFIPIQGGYHANLYTIASLIAQQLGIERVFGGNRCSYSEVDRFFSYRRCANSGRMASIIMMHL